jgi:hypothetical protein
MSDPAPVATVTRTLPTGLRVAIITAVSAAASIVVNAGLVWLATAFDPSLRHFSHFRLWDYGTLTVVGVVAAGAAWFFATRYLPTPRPTFFRVAIVVSLVLWLPDLWLYLKHEPTRAVVYLVIMHAAVAVITYNFLVFGAPLGARELSGTEPVAARSLHDDTPADGSPKVPRIVWMAMMAAVGIEFTVGLVGMVYVPFSRPSGWLSHQGEGIYLFHAALGGVLGIAALAVAVRVSQRKPRHRIDRVAAISGLWGVLVGALGGFLCVPHSLRLLGMALMFLGVSVAFFGYLIPMIEDTHPVAPSPST